MRVVLDVPLDRHRRVVRCAFLHQVKGHVDPRRDARGGEQVAVPDVAHLLEDDGPVLGRLAQDFRVCQQILSDKFANLLFLSRL